MTIGLFFSCVAILILMIMSAFFSGSESALTAASRARMHTLAKEGNKRAAMVNDLRHNKDRMIGALLLGNNLVNILSSALATSVLIKLFGDAGVFYATIVMTAMLLVFSEVMPKTYALHFVDRTALMIVPFVKIVVTVFSPLTIVVARIVRSVFHMFGIDITKVNVGSDIEMLRGAIDLHRGPEEETQQQRVMLRSILDLNDVEVGEIMTHRRNVEMIDANQGVEKVIEDVLQSQYTRLPIWKDDPDNIVGIIHAKLLLKDLRDHEGRAHDVDLKSLSVEPWYVPESTTLIDQLQAFRRRREHFAMVVDEYGTLKGVVTLEDILEEIVGDIDDEMDEPVAGVRRQPNGTYVINGDVTIRDLNRELDWELPDEDYSTLAGLILHESKMIPEAGQSFNFFGFRFDIMRRQRNQITLIRVTPPPKEKKQTAA